MNINVFRRARNRISVAQDKSRVLLAKSPGSVKSSKRVCFETSSSDSPASSYVGLPTSPLIPTDGHTTMCMTPVSTSRARRTQLDFSGQSLYEIISVPEAQTATDAPWMWGLDHDSLFPLSPNGVLPPTSFGSVALSMPRTASSTSPADCSTNRVHAIGCTVEIRPESLSSQSQCDNPSSTQQLLRPADPCISGLNSVIRQRVSPSTCATTASALSHPRRQLLQMLLTGADSPYVATIPDDERESKIAPFSRAKITNWQPLMRTSF